jgi:hypothetical protein
MSERISLADIPFTQEELTRWHSAFVTMYREHRQSRQRNDSEDAALLRMLLDEVATTALSLGSTGVPDIDKCRAELVAYCCSVFDEYWDGLKDQAWWADEQDGVPAALIWEWNRAGPVTRARFLERVGCDAAGIDVEAEIDTQAEVPPTDISSEQNREPKSRRKKRKGG